MYRIEQIYNSKELFNLIKSCKDRILWKVIDYANLGILYIIDQYRQILHKALTLSA